MKIVLGAAKGLACLHEEVERPIIYRDFKTSNILLDSVCKFKTDLSLISSRTSKLLLFLILNPTQDYNAKLSDFGLAKDGPQGDKTHVSTRVMGTYGYAAPEYVMTGCLSICSHVLHVLLVVKNKIDYYCFCRSFDVEK